MAPNILGSRLQLLRPFHGPLDIKLRHGNRSGHAKTLSAAHHDGMAATRHSSGSSKSPSKTK